MKTNIRAYKEEDYDRICSWWEGHNETPPARGMMVEDGTFVLELNGTPVMTLTAFTTQSKNISFFEGYCAKPGLIKSLRNMLGEILWGHGFAYLRARGYTRTNCLAANDKLLKRYETMGMDLQCSGLHSLGRDL